MADVSVSGLTDLQRAGITKRVQFTVGAAAAANDVIQGKKLGISTVKRILQDVTADYTLTNSNAPVATGTVAKDTVLIIEGV